MISFEQSKNQEEEVLSKKPAEALDLVGNVAAEMLDTYLEHWLPPAERYKKAWLDENLSAKEELADIIAREMKLNYKLIDIRMLTKKIIKKHMYEEFIPRKINQILRKNGVLQN